MIKGMSKDERFEKARMHLMDALEYKAPRPEAYDSGLPTFFKIVFALQTSSFWNFFLFILSYFFMYLVILENS